MTGVDARRRRRAFLHLPPAFLALTVLLLIGCIAAWRFVPLSGTDALRLLAGCIGASLSGLLTVSFLRAVPGEPSSFEAALSPPAKDDRGRPASLVELGNLVAGAQRSGRDGYVKLRPVLRQIASSRLSARAVDLDTDDTARQLLGDDYRFFDARRETAERTYAKGIDLDSLERVVEKLEEL